MFLELIGTWDTWQTVEYQRLAARIPSQLSSSGTQQTSWRSVRRVGGTKNYVCKRCGRGYMWNSALKRHTNLECNKEPSYQCPYCPLKTRQLCSMKRHLKNKHALQTVPILSAENKTMVKDEVQPYEWASVLKFCIKIIILNCMAVILKL